MIYLKTGVGIELRDGDMLLSALQSNFSKATFTCFERIADCLGIGRKELADRVGRFFHDNGLGRDAVVLGVPREEVVFRHLDLPAEVKDNLKDVVRYQVQAFEPSEESGVYYDYAPPGGQAGSKRLTVLVAMVRKAYLDKQLALLRECGIRPAAVSCGSMGLGGLWLHGRKDAAGKTFFLAEVGRAGLELFALHRGRFAYSREVAKDDARDWGDLLLGEVNEAASRLRLAPGDVVEKIVLSGDCAEEALEAVRGRIPDCELVDRSFPFDAVEKTRPAIVSAAASVGLAFAGATAHPAVGLNLLPPELTRHRGRWGVAIAAALGGLALLLLAGLGVRETVQNRALLSRLKEENKKLDAPVRQVRALESKERALATEEKVLEGLVNDRDRNLDILKELTTIFPEDTFLTNYSNKNGVIQLVGQSGSSSDLIPQLEKSPLLKDVVQKGGIFKDQATGRDRFTFEARMEK
ncbi:MAG: PilN domain-containing protein [Acidobacteriota bacterium]|jgi:Tfp pilus assembly protein PilN|nr:PilN domain-containing protein [Acidobacteriota bacterium]